MHFFYQTMMIRKRYIFVTILILLACINSYSNSLLPDTATTVPTSRSEALLEISKDYNKILLLGLAFSIFTSIFLFFQVRQKHRKEKVFEAYSAETRISRKVHDEIANEIYGTILFVANEEVVSGAKKDRLISQLDDIYLRTRNISRESNDIDTGLRYAVQLKLMLNCYSTDTVNVIIKGIDKVDWEKLSVAKKIATHRVLQELMTNMTKHSEATVVLVDFKEEKKKIQITYSDNGKGLRTEKIIFKNGLQNVENRMDSIDGSVIFDTKPRAGFHLTLTYPAYTPYV